MEVQYQEILGLPVAIIDNFYDKDEYKRIWLELNFLLNDKERLLDPEKSGSAFEVNDDDEKVFLKKNKALWLDNIYADRNMSYILGINRKVFWPEIAGELPKAHTFFRYLGASNGDSTLISYYENADYYDFHEDKALITCLSWFHKSPKRFSGGALYLEENVKIECKDNRLVIFPSCIKHSVEPINMPEKYENDVNGRITMTQFVFQERGE
jgi:Rps23 Pro-64 3,4-dihydroxylase Tpa1-like proline 4-hydroxylase